MTDLQEQPVQADPGVDATGQTGRRRRRGGAGRLRMVLIQCAVVVCCLVAWQVLVTNGVIDAFYISKPTEIWHRFTDLATDGEFYRVHVWTTVKEIVYGLVIGSVVGIAAGMALAVKPVAYRAAAPVINTLYTVPRMALMPVFILWLGIGPQSKIALVVSLVFFSMLFNTYSGVRDVDAKLVDAVRLMGANKRAVVQHVYFPSIVPWIFAGLRISLVFALTGAVVGEMLVSQKGIGYLLVQRQNLYDATGVFALLTVVAILANALSLGIGAIERRFSFWREGNDGIPRG